MDVSVFIDLNLILMMYLCAFFHGVRGNIVCENLQRNSCAFAISSSGHRCVLEKAGKGDDETRYLCFSSNITVQKIAGWIESDECVQACGLDRNSLGISSDLLQETESIRKLCSPACYMNCPNIADLYFNIAAGEGVFLPGRCKASWSNRPRMMQQVLRSSSASFMAPPSSSPPPM